MFFTYQILFFFIFLISPLIIIFRILKKKEHKTRFLEKFTIFSKKRKSGNLIWFHGSSVGEILSVIPKRISLRQKGYRSQPYTLANHFEFIYFNFQAIKNSSCV